MNQTATRTANRTVNCIRSKSKPIPTLHSQSNMVYLLIGQETDKIHAVTKDRRYCRSLKPTVLDEDCTVEEPSDLSIEVDLNSTPDDNNTVYIVYHVKEFMGISRSLGNGMIDSNNHVAKLITNRKSKAIGYITDNIEYASSHDEKITYAQFTLE